jgi:hypothetical protein
MKILIIENDTWKKHKMWKLLCLASQNDAELDFVNGTIEDGASAEKFQSISIDLNNDKDVYGLQGFLHYWMEHENYNNPDGITGECEDDE